MQVQIHRWRVSGWLGSTSGALLLSRGAAPPWLRITDNSVSVYNHTGLDTDNEAFGQTVRVRGTDGGDYRLIGGIEIAVHEEDLLDSNRATKLGAFDLVPGALESVATDAQEQLFDRLTHAAWRIERALNEGVTEADEPRLVDCQLSEVRPEDQSADFYWRLDPHRRYEIRFGADQAQLTQDYAADDAWAGDREVPLWVGETRCRFDSMGLAALSTTARELIREHFGLPFAATSSQRRGTLLGRLRWQPASFAPAGVYAAAGATETTRPFKHGQTFSLANGRITGNCLYDPETGEWLVDLQTRHQDLFGTRVAIVVRDADTLSGTASLAIGELVLSPSDWDPQSALAVWAITLPVAGTCGFDIWEESGELIFERIANE
jgi:hypothetical protein